MPHSNLTCVNTNMTKPCLKKETPEERKGWKTLPRPRESETPMTISTAMKDTHQIH